MHIGPSVIHPLYGNPATEIVASRDCLLTDSTGALLSGLAYCGCVPGNPFAARRSALANWSTRGVDGRLLGRARTMR
jgi:hypothetical protein